MTHESVLCRAPGVVARTIAGETILVPVRRRAQEMGLFTLNGVGTFVWQALDGAHSLREIAGAVATAFEVDPARALAGMDHKAGTGFVVRYRVANNIKQGIHEGLEWKSGTSQSFYPRPRLTLVHEVIQGRLGNGQFLVPSDRVFRKSMPLRNTSGRRASGRAELGQQSSAVTLAKSHPEVASKMLGQQARGPVRLCQSPNNWRARDISGHKFPLFVGQLGRLAVARANP